MERSSGVQDRSISSGMRTVFGPMMFDETNSSDSSMCMVSSFSVVPHCPISVASMQAESLEGRKRLCAVVAPRRDDEVAVYSVRNAKR